MLFEKLQVGMTVYVLNKRLTSRGLKTKWIIKRIKILDLDTENRKVFASLEDEEPVWYSWKSYNAWRLKIPRGD